MLAQIHWFSIINSCVTVLLLTGFLATILMRVLKNDFVKYTKDDEAGMLNFTLAPVCAHGIIYYYNNSYSCKSPYIACGHDNVHKASGGRQLTLHGCLPAADDQEETGWKYIHGDVFRFPPHLSLFCACVGTGSQILTMAVCIFALALVGVFYPYNRGALLTACVVSRSLLILAIIASEQIPVVDGGLSCPAYAC